METVGGHILLTTIASAGAGVVQWRAVMLYPISRVALFKLEPETAHAVTLAAIARA